MSMRRNDMHDLYKKNELAFALLWIAVYCAVTMTLRGQFGDESIYLLLSLAAMAAVIGLWMKKYDLQGKYGLNTWPKGSKKYLYFLPMCFLATGNLWNGIAPAYGGIAQVWACLSMLLIGIIEEVIFRGFLFKALVPRDGLLKSIVIVAVTFGMGHIINLLTGQGGSETVAQIIFAVAWGFMFTIVFYKSKSLWPCILIHGFINASSKFGIETTNILWIYIIATAAIAAAYCTYLLKLKDETEPSEDRD